MELLQAKRRIGIGIRLAIMVAVLMVLAPGSFTAISLVSQRREAMDMFFNSSMHMGRSLKRISRFSMLENRRDEIDLAIKQISIEEAIEAVTLVDHTGKTAYSSPPAWTWLANPGLPTSCFPSTTDRNAPTPNVTLTRKARPCSA